MRHLIPHDISAIAKTRSGSVRPRLIQNRRDMSISSGFASSAISRCGAQAPCRRWGNSPALRTISGCMGQVYSVRVTGAARVTGSSAMPHFGQAPGPR